MDINKVLQPNTNFYCPITSELMVDPVIDREGNTYDRSAITQWLSLHGTSPLTRNPLSVHDLTPNRTLRSAIEEFKAYLDRQVQMTNAKMETKLGHDNTNSTSSYNSNDRDDVLAESKSNMDIETTEPPPDVFVNYAFKLATSSSSSSTDEYAPRDVDTYHCLISVDSHEDDRSHVSSDIVVVVDVSGSMGNEAKTQSVESSGLSLLDIVKHGVKTLIRTLGPNDRLAVVSFSNRARIVFNLMKMDISGQEDAIQQLDQLLPEGMTNLWDGLNTAMDLLKNRTSLSSSTSSKEQAKAGLTRVADRNAAILLLTDGEPNIEPPRGHLPMLRKYRDTNGGIYPGIISTFGFGYSLNSQLLVDIAREAGGMYAFIPDSGFVGTAFVNALANILSTVGSEVSVAVEIDSPMRLGNSLPGAADIDPTSWGGQLFLGSLQLGQSKDSLITVTLPAGVPLSNANITVTAKYRPTSSIHEDMISISGTSSSLSSSSSSSSAVAVAGAGSSSDEEIDYHIFRAKFIACLQVARKCMGSEPPNLVNAQAAVRSLLEELNHWLDTHVEPRGPKSNSAGTNGPQVSAYHKIQALSEDISGQVTQAVSRYDWYCRWGKHYLPSLSRAHELQQCNNFKDPGIQHFGGDLFRRVRDVADDVFCSLPVPIPARPMLSFAQIAASHATAAPTAGPQHQQHHSQPAAAARPVATVGMAAFNDAANPCFHEDCLVSVIVDDDDDEGHDGVVVVDHSGSIRIRNVKIGQLRRGDKLLGGGVVAYVIKTLMEDNTADLVDLGNGLLVTPYHPVKCPDPSLMSSSSSLLLSLSSSSWVFPIDLCPQGMRHGVPCGAVVSLILDNKYENYQSFMIHGYEAIALGHDIQDDPVASHGYLGSRGATSLVGELMRSRCQRRKEDADSANDDGVICFHSGWLRRQRGNDDDGVDTCPLITSMDLTKEILVAVN